jgi:hypothetical protein
MNCRFWVLSIAVTLLAGAAIAADDTEAPKAAPSASSTAAGAATPAEAAVQRCISQCEAAESKCSGEVRRARQQCSKSAANAGRDPFTMRSNDYSYFCSYFGDARRCGASGYGRGCQARFTQRYGLCVDAMYNNIAAMRYDCQRNEKDAQGFCREELRDCRAACGS